MKLRRLLLTGLLGLSIALAGVACEGNKKEGDKASPSPAAQQSPAVKLSGEINIDGSSTVYPITSAIGEEFSKNNTDVKVSVAYAGTGGGFKKFYANQIDICDASRPIKQEEIDKCKENGIEYTEFMVAYDGLSVVVNKQNTWCTSLTVDQLKAMWQPDSKIKTWKDIDPSWPDEQIKFYAPGTDSGTFEYFTEEIVKKKGAIRTDITPSEDDNVLVTGVENDKNAIAFFGFAYYEENKDRLNVVKVDSGEGPVEPAFETIKSNKYKPLSRPLFIYVNNKKMEEPHIKEFLKFYLTNAKKIVPEVGYVPLEDKDYQDQMSKIK